MSLSVALSAVAFFCTVCAFAQPAQNAGSGGERLAEREQRRVELRTVLQANRHLEVQAPNAEVKTHKAFEPPPAERHLTPRQLAEMRQQLRQQQAKDRVTALDRSR